LFELHCKAGESFYTTKKTTLRDMNAEGFSQWIDNELCGGRTTLTDDEISQLGEKFRSKVSKIVRSLNMFPRLYSEESPYEPTKV
jgi:hypothetical protein